MTKEERSRGACWTCRLRRKKCDESTPACLACTSVSIPCYGYDRNPAWADGGPKQKAKAGELRIIIRETAKTRRHQKRQDSDSGTAHGEIGGSNENHESSLHQQITQPGIPGSKNLLKDINSESPDTPPLEVHTLSISKPDPSSRWLAPSTLEGDCQANLLMHYLDVVFPSQFPFYNPTPEEGGRGWLLIMIVRTKPLYHAALSTAAYHLQTQNSQPKCFDLKVPEKGAEDNLHSLAIKELRLYLGAFQHHHEAQSLERNIEVLICIVLLVSLEVFNGDTESWQIHMKAAQNILPGLRKGCTKSINPIEPLSSSHRKAHHFFAAVICWYEIFSTTTTRLKPWAPRSCLEEAGFINLESITGCKNSVVIAIREIALLHEWKSRVRDTEEFDECRLVDRASVIEMTLEVLLEDCSESDGGLAWLNLNDNLDPASQRWSTPFAAPGFQATSRNANIPEITRIFACAALVYLHVVRYGSYAENPKIQESVSRTIMALGALRNQNTLGILVWPICLAGCMAAGPQIDFFRNLCFEVENVSSVKSGNLKKAFLIMEECWRLRESTGEADWLQAMEILNMKILLI